VIFGERNILYLPLQKLAVLDPRLSLVGHVEAVSSPAGRAPLGREQYVYAPTAPEIQHHLPRESVVRAVGLPHPKEAAVAASGSSSSSSTE
jgi:hypothetical protein